MELFDFMKTEDKRIQEGFKKILRDHLDVRLTPVTDKELRQNIKSTLKNIATN